MVKPTAARIGLFKFQNYLEPLKTLTGRIQELSVRGDVSQAYIDEIIAAIKPTVVTERALKWGRLRALRMSEKTAEEKVQNVSITDAINAMVER